MVGPLDDRRNQGDNDPDGFALPLPPPGLPGRGALRPLRVLPTPGDPEREAEGVDPDPAGGGALRLRGELAAVRHELEALQDMLEELPAILERKFQHRLRDLLEEQRALAARNDALREQLRALAPAPAPASLPAGAAGGLAGGWGRTVRRALGMAQPSR